MTIEVPADHLPAGAFAPVRPRYGAGSLAELLPSVSAVLGVPGAVDALGLGERLDGVRKIAVLLVDGLGAYQIPVAVPHAPVLGDLTRGTEVALTSAFPSTTPVALVTLGTGARPGEHGVLGFTVRRPDGRILNHIRWWDDPDPMRWQPVPTWLETAAASGVAVTVANRSEFAGSGLTVASVRGGAYAGVADGAELAGTMLAALIASPGPALVYGYHPDLDRSGHDAGVDSDEWRSAARGVDALLGRLVAGLPEDAALLVTADHGQLNVLGRPFDMGVDADLALGVAAVAGEPRVRYLYPVPGARDDVLAAYRAVLGDAAWVMTRDEAIGEGWFGPVPPEHADRVGEIVVICRDRAVVLASGWEPAAVGNLVAYHGSMTAAEMIVPLLIARGDGL